MLPPITAREVVSLDFDWRFHLGDEPTAAAPDFDDHSWRELDVPHDWAWEADYAPDAAQLDKGGYKPGGIGWYRRVIDVPAEWADRTVRLEFDGVYMDSMVWLNGKKLGGRAYGYISFGFDLTPYLQPGRNVLAVRVDNSREPSARWYHGCGIYAPVRLVVTDAVRVAPFGVQITTPTITDESATVLIVTTLAGEPPPGTTVTTRLLAADGTVQDEITQHAGTSSSTQSLRVNSPRRWDIDTPVLYTAVTELKRDGVLVDTVTTRFGIREIDWKTNTGFWLNGHNVKLLGVAEHLEGGPVGAAYPPKLLRWKLELLKTMGVNAVRTAHNPQIPQFYALCDELGLLVMDEIFDGWSTKAPEDYGAHFFADNWERDLRDWLRRDRNHPSVIIYSVGNETRGEIAAELVRFTHEMDPTRPVTSGHSGSEFMDVFGVNGHSEQQSFFTEERPARPFVATEAPHTWQVRGYYRSRTWWRDGYPSARQDPFPLPDLTKEEIFTYDWAPATAKVSAKQVFNSSYDNATVRISARKSWELLRDLPWFAGQFRWTGFDYVGEAGFVHGGWPFRAFMGGALDLAGFKKDLFYFYQSQWTTAPMVHLLPHWTHPRMILGTPIPVQAYSNAAQVELFLNGRSLGTRQPGIRADDMACQWLVPWEPGVLEAVAYRDGQEVSRTRQVTAAAPTQLRVTTDTTELVQDGLDVAIVTIAQHDETGAFYPYGENQITFHLEGPAQIVSLENGNPVDTSPNFGVTTRRTFFGLTRAFVRATREPGTVALVVGAINGERRQLTSDQVSIEVQRVALRGPVHPGDFRIYYTTDGSPPSSASTVYSEPFAVTPGTTVRALVREGDQDVMTLSESFSATAGLHWLAPGESSEVPNNGRQAEQAALAGGATIATAAADFHGTGYAIIPAGGSVEWYEENDGSASDYTFLLRWQAPAKAEIEFSVNGQPASFPPLGPHPWWNDHTFVARLQSGSNHLRLTVKSGGPFLADELKIAVPQAVP